jgi:hypothetical protein
LNRKDYMKFSQKLNKTIKIVLWKEKNSREPIRHAAFCSTGPLCVAAHCAAFTVHRSLSRPSPLRPTACQRPHRSLLVVGCDPMIERTGRTEQNPPPHHFALTLDHFGPLPVSVSHARGGGCEEPEPPAAGDGRRAPR